ncbi:hypothetical protein SD37_24510 [Amycolatopsis orientalis]|uniref:DUF3068 domain-containing protein n=1 Tax=Amycolatopsis orientalis TaxID=31958 RepID=A0A193C226_AMYOR|nr:DUF3068 domain-containing protein [Amycolatopsis orientalis]ANN18474.1 hypothetical protein SD37_24510 [Amycolatopsis orientalis]
MRRALSLIFLALGVFAVAGAVSLPTYVKPELAKVPLNQDSTSVLEGTASKVLAVKTVGGKTVTEIRDNAKLKATAHVVANFAPPEMREGTDVAVWLLAVSVVDTRDDTVVNASKRQVCFDRRTAEGYLPPGGDQEAKCSATSSFVTKLKDKPEKENQKPEEIQEYKPQPGLNFKFPFGTEQKDYQVYDDNTGRAVQARFKGVEEIKGVEVYKFVQEIPDTKVSMKKVPGSLIGATGNSVEAGQFYRGTITSWIEPVTGIQVKQEQQSHQELRSAANPTPTVVFDGTLTFTDATVDKMVQQVDENKGKLDFISSTGPVVLGILGAVFLALGVFLLVKRRRAPSRH